MTDDRPTVAFVDFDISRYVGEVLRSGAIAKELLPLLAPTPIFDIFPRRDFLREAMHSLHFLVTLYPTDRRREKREARRDEKRGKRSSRGWRKHKRRTN